MWCSIAGGGRKTGAQAASGTALALGLSVFACGANGNAESSLQHSGVPSAAANDAFPAAPQQIVASHPSAGEVSAQAAGYGDETEVSHVSSAGAPAGTSAASLAPLTHHKRVSLVDHAFWKLLDADADPFGDRPSQVRCEPSGAAPELLSGEDAFGVDTGTCGYVTARQATRDYVATGETLRIRLWHFVLTAPTPAEAHAAIQIDGTTVFDEHIAIPTGGALIKRELAATRAFPAGAPILFHLHNHGDNSWALVEVSTGP